MLLRVGSDATGSNPSRRNLFLTLKVPLKALEVNHVAHELEKSKVNEREAYKRQLRESLKDQMRESAEKRRAEFENSRNETARTVHDFRSRR